MTSTTTARQQRDSDVAAILADLRHVIQTGEFAAPLTGVSEKLRAAALSPNSAPLLAGQKAKLLEGLGAAYLVLHTKSADDEGRTEAHVVANSWATLVLAWAGDDPRWSRTNPAVSDAAGFALGFELAMLRNLVLDWVVSRNKAVHATREAIFSRMLLGAMSPGKA